MNIALGQLSIVWEDKEANFEKAEICLKALESQGTELFLLPEMSMTGFSMRTERTKESGRETVERMSRLARRYGIAVGTGWVKDAGETCENHYTIVTPDGELLDYAKLHPFSYSGEDRRFRGGGRLPACRYGNFSIGVQICYDLRFPEPFQRLSRSADLIVVPANWPAARREDWMCLLRARAIETQSYVAGINCVGVMDGQEYAGDSGLFAAGGKPCEGEVLYPFGENKGEQLLLFSVKNDVHTIREGFPVKKDRRERLYAGWYG
ncbi:MAG: nitrilase-related carbon-nitrogen hydrolase [Eubacteriales bacterium]|nr:nitrilase-related carbon-nitrogen hydrolase [Eubacteriales bacterium]